MFARRSPRPRLSFCADREFSVTPFGKREKLAENYLSQRDWTCARALANRRAVQQTTGFAKQLEVNWVASTSTVFDAVKTMADAHVGSVLVCKDPSAERKALMGIFTERDYLRKVAVKDLSSRTTPVSQIMTPRSAMRVIYPEFSLYECLDEFENATFRHLPVVVPRPDLGANEEDVVAVLSMRDMVHEFRRFHFANLEYLEEYIDFPVW